MEIFDGPLPHRAAMRPNIGHSTPLLRDPEAVGRAMTRLNSYYQFDNTVVGPEGRSRWFRVTNRSFAECTTFNAGLAASCYLFTVSAGAGSRGVPSWMPSVPSGHS